LLPLGNAKVAKRFLEKALGGVKEWEKPPTINTDKAPAYGYAIRQLKEEGKCPEDLEHRQVKYLNKRVEADPGKLKRPINPVGGFQSMRTAYATVKGFELM
jgi:transposase-like protein